MLIIGEELGLFRKSLKINICLFRYPDVTIYAGELSIYEFPEIVYQDPNFVFDVKLIGDL